MTPRSSASIKSYPTAHVDRQRRVGGATAQKFLRWNGRHSEDHQALYARTELAVRDLEVLAARTALREARIASTIAWLKLLATWTAAMGQHADFYNTARWQRLRKHQLLEHPALCLLFA